MSNDASTTFKELSDLLRVYLQERGWEKFHNPKDIAASLSVEANELLELFLWRTPEELYAELENNPKFRTQVQDELGDIILCCLNFAHNAKIDISQAFKEKLKKQALKYPADQVQGSVERYFELKYKNK
ncbi:nucleotide pyrophosphohydrolase [Candidatus Babeliales bacterium]|nr:nucleotide pyrophosphohydrolase [Candidatus Babeliales bacterium]